MKLTLNLATRPYVNRSLLYAVYAGLLVVLSLVTILSLLSYLRSREASQRLRQHIAELKRQTLPASPGESYSAADYALLVRRIEFANTVLERDSLRRSLLFDRIEALMVDGIRLRSLQPDFKTRSVRLSGTATEVVTLRRFLDRLVASPAHAQVYLLQQSQRKTSGDDTGVDFSIELREKVEP